MSRRGHPLAVSLQLAVLLLLLLFLPGDAEGAPGHGDVQILGRDTRHLRSDGSRSYYVIQKQPERVIGPLAESAFWANDVVASAGALKWRQPTNPHPEVARQGQLLFLAFTVAFFGGLLLLLRLVEIAGGRALLRRSLVGGALYLLLQAATAAILILAANTSYADFPRLGSIMAADGYLPKQLKDRGSRLVYSNGLMLLTGVSVLLLIVFAGDTHRLTTGARLQHGVTPTLGATKQQYAVPLLKGTWMTSPFKEDAANPGSGNVGSPDAATNHAHIDNVVSVDDSKFAGLCMRCHYKQNLTNGTDHTWKSQDRVHESVKGWKTANTTIMHNFTCSKCHAPHNSGLNRLMVTSCLNYNHQGQRASGGGR